MNLQSEIENEIHLVGLSPEDEKRLTAQLHALFKKAMEEAIGKEVPYPNTAGISKDFAEVINFVIKDIRANLERILE